MRIYTDGSRIEDRAGCGLVLFKDEWATPSSLSLKGPEYATVLQMEIAAIRLAAARIRDEWEHNQGPIFRTFTICDL